MQSSTLPAPRPSIASMSARIDEMLAALPATKEQAAQMETAELLAILGNAPLAITRLLVIYAAVWSVLRERGVKLDRFIDCDNEVYRHVRAIAAGHKSAAAVAKFGAKSSVSRVVLKLPLADQERLASDGFVEVLDPKTPEQLGNVIRRPVLELRDWELRQVFAPGPDRTTELRTAEGQARYLAEFSGPQAPKVSRRELVRGRLALDRETNRVRTLGPDADLEHAVALLKAMGYGVTPPE